ncbi:hypothetical protein BD410DRAFT_285211 [Rickenella mellea]|uniref:Uncharacterized protein n=1 Tax=Rickenella mellea TaxID=50990 RepID=A0A4Y7PG99_9AGAM|nr:hypothetical protein BD410DRAFT_285211 [Rickenella mellea]
MDLNELPYSSQRRRTALHMSKPQQSLTDPKGNPESITWYVYASMPDTISTQTHHFAIILHDVRNTDKFLASECKAFGYRCLCKERQVDQCGIDNFILVGTLESGKKPDFDRIVKTTHVVDAPELSGRFQRASSYPCLFNFQAAITALKAKGIIKWDEHNLSIILAFILEWVVPALDVNLRPPISVALRPIFSELRENATKSLQVKQKTSRRLTYK